MPRRFILAVLVAVLAIGSTTLAQAQKKKGPNGGMVVTSEGHPIEFVHDEQEVVFYFSDDDGSPLATRGMTGRAVIQAGGKTATVKLAAAQPNKMVGKLQAPLAAKARVVMSVRFSAEGHSHTLQGRFTTN